MGIAADAVYIQPTLQILDSERAVYYNNPFMDNIDQTLVSWVNQGVLLLNASLTCEAYKPETPAALFKEGTHACVWRTCFMEDFFSHLCNDFENLVFVFCGGKAQYYEKFVINKESHTSICVPHPVSDWNKGVQMFRGSNVFGRINDALSSKNKSTIEW